MATVSLERHRAPPKAPLEEGGIRLAAVLGVEIRLDWSLLLIFGLVLFNLGAGLLPRWHPDWSPTMTWTVALGAAVLFFGSILVHEFSHALVARRNGIPVSRITLFLFGGMAHMEGEPPSPKAEFLMAVVGPITSLVIGAVAVAGSVFLAGPDFAARLEADPEAALRALGPWPSLLLWLGPINLVLGLFNLLPGFPLDGGRVFRSLLWWITGDLRKATRWASGAGRLLALGLMALGLMGFLRGALAQGMWLLLIGWFLNNAAVLSYRNLLVQEGLTDVPLSEVMRTRFSTVGPGMSLETLVREELMAGDQRAFPVLSDGALAGLVCLEDVRKVPPERWPETPVSAVMTPADRLAALPPEASAYRAFKALAKREVEQIPVLEGDRLVGLVRRQDLLKWLSLHLGQDDARLAGEPA